jgi:fructosamine-3-kinase
VSTTSLSSALAESLGSEVVASAAVGGGDVARSFRVDLADGRRVFAKTHPHAPAVFFTTEATGLRWLRAVGVVAVPEVLAVSDGDPSSGVPNLLALEWIAEGPARAGTEEELGRALAAVHAAPWPCFGRPDGATTGSRGLPNDRCDTWAGFYGSRRLVPLARLARDTGALDPVAADGLEALAGRLGDLGGPVESPSLLHGDLWAGNRLVDTEGRNWLIDPAAHGGHREFDLAMMRLFGGFGLACFAAYDEALPLADGWEARVALHQIAPLVVHAIKFGGGYVRSATEAVARYC